MRAFENLNKPTTGFRVERPKLAAVWTGCALGINSLVLAKLFDLKPAEAAEAANLPDPPDSPKPADETVVTLSEEPNEDASNNKDTQERSLAN